jgi:WhiB family transcriptional regulator, redox-sensing transcriptional regulator
VLALIARIDDRGWPMKTETEAGSWMDRAACASADPDLFFPVSSVGPGSEQIRRAKQICRSCPVLRDCLTFALRTRQAHGVWGGTSEEERIRALRGRPEAAPEALAEAWLAA